MTALRAARFARRGGIARSPPLRDGPAPNSAAVAHFDIAWLAWFLAIGALFFLQMSQTLAASVFMGATAAYVAARPGLALKAVLAGWTPWAYVIFAGLSILWSQHPDVSMRAALQIAFTLAAGLVMARALSARSCISVMMCAALAADAASLANPQTAWNAGALAMIGIFGSKNQLGLSQAILVMACGWILLDGRRAWAVRMVALVGALLGLYLLIAARSLDATAALLVASGGAVVAFKLDWFPRRWRASIVVAALLVMAVLVLLALIYADDANLFGQILLASGKNATLSGRTDLWARAAKMMEENPVLGTGLQAFWVQGNTYAEELWARFAPGRAGYHFHNLWYESGVELGYVGLLVAIATVALTTLEVWRWAIRSPGVESCFFLTYVTFIDMRTFVEVDLFGQYSFDWVLFVAAWAYARRSLQRYP